MIINSKMYKMRIFYIFISLSMLSDKYDYFDDYAKNLFLKVNSMSQSRYNKIALISIADRQWSPAGIRTALYA